MSLGRVDETCKVQEGKNPPVSYPQYFNLPVKKMFWKAYTEMYVSFDFSEHSFSTAVLRMLRAAGASQWKQQDSTALLRL